MALALKNAGKKVLVIGLLEGENFLDGEENGRFQGIDYINITQKKSKLPFRFTNHLFFGRKIVKCLSKQDVKQEDYIIVYLIPIFIGELLNKGKMSVKVLRTNDTWYGMTYHEDVAAVKDSFKKMLADGMYKADLFSDL